MNKRKFNRLAGLDLLAKRNKSKVAETVKVEFGNACRMSMIAFEEGKATDVNWHTLGKSLSVALVLSERGVIPEGLSAIKGGLDSLHIIKEIGTYQLGSHAFSINSAVNIFLKQLEVATNYQVSSAEIEVIVRVEHSRLVAEDMNHCT